MPMITFRRILCPIDFSPISERALKRALAIARWHGSSLTVLHVEDFLIGAARAEVSPDNTVHAIQELHDLVARAGGPPNVAVRLTSGDAARTILDEAKQQSSDLIVMGTRGRSGLARAVLGSVAEQVVRESICPVMTVPATADAPASEVLDPFDPILCAIDFSPSCRKALDLAVAMAQEADARLILLHALPIPPASVAVPPNPLPLPARFDVDELRRDAVARLKRGIPSDTVFRCKPEVAVVEGSPADAILQRVSDEAVKLIVMGVQARGALDRLIFGSTTRRVMQAATCPVLSTRADRSAEAWDAWPAADAAHEAAAS